MDPSLLKQQEAFKKRLEAASVSRPRPKKEGPAKSQVRAKIKKSASKPVAIPSPATSSQLSGDVTKGLNNPHRVLKSVMDLLKERYISKEYKRLSFGEILEEIKRQDLTVELSNWLVDALCSNPKIDFDMRSQTYLYKPALGLGVRNRRQLLELLKQWDDQSKGGMLMSDVRESVHKPDRAIQKLDEDGLLLRVTRPDKEEVIFYNNPMYSLATPLSEDLRSMWHRVSVDGQTETDIENYLQRVGLGAMAGQSSNRKRKAPSQQRQQRKRTKNVKISNTHLDSELFKDNSIKSD